ncbi:MFS transporter [Belliella kenyensis]|uniref:MFS transporter n=1 Tax=Belliella kenyensis TaxID=1472724 RepID=A0ABV8EMZ3_9BACT|nr:MFS transporter [Belliella kenyensis]MCH7401456.1 MFS transporter [Belliella kenyensis]MDN3603263.1 MFS transporter [Belliella kenyensis]
MNSKILIKLSLVFNYMVFAVLLNSVGAVILQVQRTFDVSKAEASILEGFKDLPIAIFSFLVASFLPKLGIKKGMLFALAIVAALCWMIPLLADDFWYFKLLFAGVGVSFAVIKVSVFATIGLVTDSTKSHSSLMSTIEGFFMVGVLLGNVFFSLFVNDLDPTSMNWLNIYWFLGALAIAAAILLILAEIDETASQSFSKSSKDDFLEMLKLVIKPLVIVFAISAFLFVLIEQSFMTWTPTFYQEVLKVPASMGIQAGAVLAGALAIGRLLAGVILKKVHWLTFTLLCTVLVGVCVLLTLPLTASEQAFSQNITWFDAPFVVYLFPLLGVFLAPIYPTINSVVLSSLPKYLQSSMSGLIVVFSALGGTTGSMVTGHIFEAYGGVNAFYFSLIPIFALCLILILLNRQVKKQMI